jgi:hypothetical protein
MKLKSIQQAIARIMAEKSAKEWIAVLYAAALDSPMLNDFMEISATLFSSKLKAGMRNYGVALGTLHLMQPFLVNELDSGSSGKITIAGVEVPIAGAISNLKEGDLSVSFAASSGGIENSYASKVTLTKTKWGALLWELISSNAIFMGVAAGGI